MLLKIVGFNGEQPALDPRLLDNAKSTEAVDTRLTNGNIRTWNYPKFITTLDKVGEIKSIYRFGQTITNEDSYWFHWTYDVDVVRGPVPDEATERTYWTGEPPYPRMNYLPIAINGGNTNYPSYAYRLGVPAPEQAITVVAGTRPALDPVDTSKPVEIVSVVSVDATTARVTLAAPTDFDITKPTKISVAGADQTQFNGTYDLTWESTTQGTYTPTAVGQGTTKGTKTLSINNIQRIDATTAQVSLSAISDFLRNQPTTIAVSGCNVAQYNGTFPAIWINEQTIQYHPTKPNQTVSFSETNLVADFTVTRYDEFTAQVTLNNPTLFDTGSSCRVTVQNFVSPTCINGTFDATWVDSSTLRYRTISEIPVDPITGPANAPWPTITITGPVVIDIPATPSPTGVSTVTLNGTLSTALPTNTTVTGITTVYLSGMATPEDNREIEDRNYVCTFVTPLGEEGPPSPVSAVVEVVAGQSVSLSGIPVPPNGGGWNLPGNATKRLYRSATSGTSAVYLFLAEIPVAQTTYQDTTDAAGLGEALPSEYWNPPPDGLKGLTMLAGGILAGFKGNEVWFSEPNLPHAWPSRNMVALDYEVVALGAFGQSVCAATVGHPYIITGVDPMQMTPVKLPTQQSCVSKRSMVEMEGAAIFASPDGLCMVDGNGVHLITSGLIERTQWQSYNPSSIHGAYHDGRYYAFYTLADNVTKGCLVFDLSGDGATLWKHSAWYSAAFNDVSRDALYLVDGNNRVQKWNEGASPIPYEWTSKVFEVAAPTNFGCAQILADAYPVHFYVSWGDDINNMFSFMYTASDDKPVRLKSGFRARYWKVRVTACTKEVSSIILASTPQELTGV